MMNLDQTPIILRPPPVPAYLLFAFGAAFAAGSALGLATGVLGGEVGPLIGGINIVFGSGLALVALRSITSPQQLRLTPEGLDHRPAAQSHFRTLRWLS